MKALSLSQPWCWAVLHAGKHIENRSWQPPISMIGQQIVIHAAKSWDNERKYRIHYATGPERWRSGEALTPTGYLIELGCIHAPCRKDLYPAGAIVGLATIDRIVTKPDTLPEDQKRWFFGEFGWVLKNVIALPAPIPCGGKQGLWTVHSELLGQIREQAAA